VSELDERQRGEFVSGGAVVVAAALDTRFREPPPRAHPVRWAGRYLDAMGRLVPSEPARPATVVGGVAWLSGAVVAVLAGAAIERMTRRMPAWLRGAASGVALWPLLSCRLLVDEVAAVERALAVDVDAGRAAVARIVSRDVQALSAAQVRAAALESLAENLSDSVVAPLAWFAVGGLPAAALYRYVNTADAMWGYRTPRWQYAGRVAARSDDLLNLVPARVTALLIAGRAARISRLRREARRTPSPNAGWPMAALGMRLGVRLEKAGSYVLNADGRAPVPSDTEAALRLVRGRAVWIVAAAAALAVARGRSRS
jgi:adenosylcobinamide-phosphate synthase